MNGRVSRRKINMRLPDALVDEADRMALEYSADRTKVVERALRVLLTLERLQKLNGKPPASLEAITLGDG